MTTALYNPYTETPYHIAGDPEDVYRARSNIDDPRGVSSGHRFHKLCEAHPQIRYKDRLLECDLYRDPDTGKYTLHLICPKCLHSLKIESGNKDIYWDEDHGISIEPFTCTWEEGRGTDGTENDRIAFGVGLCNWRVGVKNGIARDA